MATPATGKWTLNGLYLFFTGVGNWTSDIRGVFATSSWVPNQDTHDFRDDITNVVTGTNLTATGLAIPNEAVVIDGTANTISLDGDSISQAGVTATGIAGIGLCQIKGGLSSADPLFGYGILGSPISPAGETLVVTPDARGWLSGAIA